MSQLLVSLDLRPRVGVYSSENRRSRLYAQSPIKPKVLAEEGGLIFARLRYCSGVCDHRIQHIHPDRKTVAM